MHRRQRGSSVPIHTDNSPEVLDLSVRIHTDNNNTNPASGNFNVSFPIEFKFLVIPESVQSFRKTVHRLGFNYNICSYYGIILFHNNSVGPGRIIGRFHYHLLIETNVKAKLKGKRTNSALFTLSVQYIPFSMEDKQILLRLFLLLLTP